MTARLSEEPHARTLRATRDIANDPWTSEWSASLERLAARGVASLGLGSGLTRAELPQPLVDACERYGVDLVEMPEAESQGVERQRRFIALAGRTGSMDAMLAELAEVVGGAAMVVDRLGNAVSGPAGLLPDGFELDGIAREVGELRSRPGRVASAVGEAGVHLEIQPIGSHERPDQYLAVVAPATGLGRLHRHAVTTVVALLGIAVDRRQHQLETDRGLRAKAMTLVVRGEVESANLILEMLPQRGRLPRTARFVRASGSEGAVADALLQAELRGLLASCRGRELEILVRAAGSVLADLMPPLVALGLRIGVSAPFETQDAPRGYARAGHALAASSKETPVVWWQELVREGTGAIFDAVRAEAWSESYLEGLDPVLRETLLTFLLHHGSRGKVADVLHVHRNTIRTRIAQVEKVLGASLEDPSTRADAWIALSLQSR